MAEHGARGPTKLLAHIGEHLSHAAIGGLILMLTGFTPEHLFVEGLAHASVGYLTAPRAEYCFMCGTM